MYKSAAPIRVLAKVSPDKKTKHQLGVRTVAL
jgi:hypothetical protein